VAASDLQSPVNADSSARGEGQSGVANSHARLGVLGHGRAGRTQIDPPAVGPSVTSGWSVLLSSLVARTAVVVLT
jgi:hypothetical protein